MLALGLGLAQEGAGVADEGLDLLAKLRHPCLQVIHGVGLGAVDPLQRQVLPLQNARQMVPELFRVQQLAGHDGLLLVLVRIERGDALLGGAVLLVRQAGLLQGVQVPVPGQQQGRPVADFQVLRRDGHALVHDVGHLSPQALAIQSHAVAQDVHHTLAEDAGGQQVQGKLAELVHHGMAGVAAALIADHHVVVRGHQVYHAALALVSPVDSHDGTI